MGKYARVTTDLPGPKSKELIRKKEEYIANAFTLYLPAIIDRGQGAVFTDIDGNSFIDFGGGVGVLNTGHCPPDVVRAIQEQVARFIHTDFSIVPYQVLIDLAARLAELAPGPSPKKCCFFNSGAEAVENAVKIAKKATKRKALITFECAFHGRTLLCMTLTSRVKPYKEDFGPFAPDVYRIPSAYCYRCSYGLTYPGCDLACVEALNRFFATTVSAREIAAVVAEPVQGEGGFIVPPKDYFVRLKQICERHGILLILDEVQTGFGRTGTMFASEQFDVEPDLMPVAKSIAAGIPLSGVIGRREVMDAPEDSTIGGTYVGSPVGCAAALEVLNIIERDNLLERSRVIGRRLTEAFRDFQGRHSVIGDVRGLGAMVAMEFVKDQKTKEPAPDITMAVTKAAMKRGLLLLKSGIYGSVIRILVPLVITDEQLDEAIGIIGESLDEVCRTG
jgi:4-aminobutyrate aminotransferase/(S)-3-amino-2-methylpropionate transaminase